MPLKNTDKKYTTNTVIPIEKKYAIGLVGGAGRAVDDAQTSRKTVWGSPFNVLAFCVFLSHFESLTRRRYFVQCFVLSHSSLVECSISSKATNDLSHNGAHFEVAYFLVSG